MSLHYLVEPSVHIPVSSAGALYQSSFPSVVVADAVVVVAVVGIDTDVVTVVVHTDLAAHHASTHDPETTAVAASRAHSYYAIGGSRRKDPFAGVAPGPVPVCRHCRRSAAAQSAVPLVWVAVVDILAVPALMHKPLHRPHTR